MHVQCVTHYCLSIGIVCVFNRVKLCMCMYKNNAMYMCIHVLLVFAHMYKSR